MNGKALRAKWSRAGFFPKGLFIASSLFIVLFLFSPVIPIVLNTTVSMPRGLYYSYSCDLKKGDLIQFLPPSPHLEFAVGRGYISPKTKGLLKSIVANSGDLVCWADGTISLNCEIIANLSFTDSQGRPLDHPEGCFTLSKNQILPMAIESAGSFDGRYFGFMTTDDVDNCLFPLLIIGK